jgi:hypothetical protein
MMDNFKIYALNTATFIFSLTEAEAGLKIFLLLLSIVYTSLKIHDWFKNKKDNAKEQ